MLLSEAGGDCFMGRRANNFGLNLTAMVYLSSGVQNL